MMKGGKCDHGMTDRLRGAREGDGGKESVSRPQESQHFFRVSLTATHSRPCGDEKGREEVMGAGGGK